MKVFTRGQKATLASFGLDVPAPQLSLAVALDLTGQSEIDVCCFGLDEQGRLSDERYFVFYNQPQSPCGSIAARGTAGDARQVFAVDLSKLPSTVKRLVFTATVEGSASMRQITRGAVRLATAGITCAEFHLQGSDYGDEKALMLAEVYWKDGWRFAATGQGFAAGLPGLLKHFGGEVAEDRPAPPLNLAPRIPDVPPPLPTLKVSIKKLTLEKQGERKSISLEKSTTQSAIHFNLNWDLVVAASKSSVKPADLDLACLYRLYNEEIGWIQALGGQLGRKTEAPYIYLDKDDRSGVSSDGENLFICRPDLIESVLVYAFIYEGVGNFSTVNGRLTLYEKDGIETLIRLDAPRPNATYCAICLLRKSSSGLEIIKENNYFTGANEMISHYNSHFGFDGLSTKTSK